MLPVFPDPIKNLPLADIPLEGCTAYLSQAEDHQILFMKFEKEVILPEHTHESQWGVVLAGKIELTIDGERKIFQAGDHYYIPAGVKHSGIIYPGYQDITYFNQPDRYQIKKALKN
ncbi:MAG: cupin domain-containing protein [Spirochaetes bacterium]|nr:cupin domain-containing protein [Spirochaetota bacterium]